MIKHPKYSFDLPPADYGCVILDEKMSVSRRFEDILNMIIACQSYSINHTPMNRLLFDLQFSAILIAISDCVFPENMEQNMPSLLLKIVLYILKNYTEQIGLDDLSRKFLVSKSYIAKLFKKHLNMSAITFIKNLKLTHAAELLKNSNLNVTEIAKYLGFSDCFFKAFQKEVSGEPYQLCKACLSKHSMSACAKCAPIWRLLTLAYTLCFLAFPASLQIHLKNIHHKRFTH